MIVGFTGTRKGTTCQQFHALYAWLRACPAVGFHHGACLGADVEACRLAHDLYGRNAIVAHPSNIGDMTSPVALELSYMMTPPRPPLARNRDIVNACDVLLACPEGPETLRSGTWSTVRFARKISRPVVIVWPDGRVDE